MGRIHMSLTCSIFAVESTQNVRTTGMRTSPGRHIVLGAANRHNALGVNGFFFFSRARPPIFLADLTIWGFLGCLAAQLLLRWTKGDGIQGDGVALPIILKRSKRGSHRKRIGSDCRRQRYDRNHCGH